MEISIQNMRGVPQADIRLGKVTLLAGPNGAGKTSVLKAVSHAITGAPLPDGITKKECAVLIHEGCKDALVEVRGDTGTCRLSLPAALISTDGKPPVASKIAVGLSSLCDMTQSERAVTLGEYLKADPGRDEVFRALRDIGIEEDPEAKTMRDRGAKMGEISAALKTAGKPMDEFGLVLAEIASGWDDAHTRAIEANKTAKGRWKQVTKANYGSAIALTWKPEGWTAQMDFLTVDKLETALAVAETAHETALKAQGGSSIERAAKQALADGWGDAYDASEAAIRTATEAQTNVLACKNKIDALPAPVDADHSLACPHCAKPVRIARGDLMGGDKLEKADTAISAGEITKRRDDRAAASGDHSKAIVDAGAAERALASARLALQMAADAKEWITKNPASSAGATADIAGPAAAVAAAETALAMFKRRDEASVIAAEIEKRANLIAILDPKGLRRASLTKILEAFNGTDLMAVTETAGWLPVRVELGDDIEFTYGGRRCHPAIISKSEMWRVEVALQVALARIDNSEIIIIDGADILTAGPDRQGLLYMLTEEPALSMVGMTLPVDRIPNLPESMGKTYVVEAGTVRAMAQEIAA